MTDSPLQQLITYLNGGNLPDPVQLAWAISQGYLLPAPPYAPTSKAAEAVQGVVEMEKLVAIKIGAQVKTMAGTHHPAGSIGWVLDSGRDKMGKEYVDVLLRNERRLLRLFDHSLHRFAALDWPVKFVFKPFERNLWPDEIVS